MQSAHITYIPSDMLAQLRDLISRDANLAALVGRPLQLRLIIDANGVLSILYWLVGLRRDPSARTDLQELLASGTVVVFAPYQLIEEVEEHIPDIVDDLAGTIDNAEELIREEWRVLQQAIHFCTVDLSQDLIDQSRIDGVDPDDLPYIVLADDIGAAAIFSRDRHINAMGGTRVGRKFTLQIREYARGKSVELTIKLGGYYSVVIVFSSIASFGELMVALAQTLAQTFARFPKWLQLAMVIAVVTGVGMAAAHPRSRTVVVETLLKGFEGLSSLRTIVEPAVYSLLETFAAESARATDAESFIERNLPDAHEARLESVAFAVCLAAGEALPTREIARRVLMAGYEPRSPNSQGSEDYLRRVLRNSASFVRNAGGGWTLSQQHAIA